MNIYRFSQNLPTFAAAVVVSGLVGSAHADPVHSFNMGTGNPVVTGDVPAADNPNGLQITGQVDVWPNIWTGTPSATDDGVTLTFSPADWGGTVGDTRGNGVGKQALRNGTFLTNEADIPWTLSGLMPNAFYDMIWYNKRDSPGETRHPNTGVNGFDAGNGVGASAPLDADQDQNFIGVQADGSGEISGTWFLEGGAQDITSVAGVQVAESATAGPPAPFVITEIEYDPDAEPNGAVTLTWSKTMAASYIAKISTDMSDWGTDIGDSLMAEGDLRPEDAEHITMTLALPPGPEFDGDLFFRIEEE